MLDVLFKPHMDRLWAPLGHAAGRLGFTPNSVTYLSLVLCCANAAAYTLHENALAFGLGLLVFEALDNIDGALARATNRCTDFGSYLDAVTDRYKDAVAVLAVGVVTSLWQACGVLLAGSLLVSYTQARAQAQGVQGSPGGVLPMFERLERVVTLALGLVVTHFCAPEKAPGVLAVVLWTSAALTHLTALQRICGAGRVLRMRESATAPPGDAPATVARSPGFASGVAHARRSYATGKGDTEWQGDWPAYVLFRPVSFALTPVAVALGVSATSVTCLCGVLACLLPCVASRVQLPLATLGVGLLGALFQLLDCVDGNVARVRRTESARGDYLSMLVGQWYWLMLLVAFGQLAARSSAGWLHSRGVALGAVLGALVVLGRLSREYVRLRTAKPQRASAPPTTWLARARLFGSGLDNLIFAVPAVAGMMHLLEGAFLATGVYVLGVFGVSQYECWRALRA